MATSKKKVTRKKPVKRKKKKQGLSQGARLLLAGAFLLGFVILSLFLLVGLRDHFLTPPALVYEEPVHEVKQHKIYSYEDIHQLIENQLLNGPKSMGWRRLDSENNADVRKIFGEFPSDIFLDELTAHIEHTNSPAALGVEREKGLIRFFWDDVLQMELRYRVPEKQQASRARIAIIMDDMGGSLSTFRKLIDLDIPVTPAILPGTRQAANGAELMRQADREYMIHIPMQPRSYPRTNPGSNALLLGQSESQTRKLVRSYLEAVPGAVGGNNHMGSRYTEEVGPMRIVLDELKKNGQFFIDSRTIGSSVGFSEARKMGLRTATRNIFLDNEESVPYIRKQIRKMVKMAGRNKEVIAICHPYRETIEAFKQEMGWLKQQPVDFVEASSVVHTY